jgi:hypothetical protein
MIHSALNPIQRVSRVQSEEAMLDDLSGFLACRNLHPYIYKAEFL